MAGPISSEKYHVHKPHPREVNLSKCCVGTSRGNTKILRLDWVPGRSDAAVLEVLATQMRESLEVAHDYAEYLWERIQPQLDSEACRHLRMLLRACDHLETLVELLTRFERAGRLHQVSAEVNLSAILEEIRHRVRGSDGRAISLETDPELPVLAGDVELLKDLFLIVFQLGSRLMVGASPQVEIRIAESSPSHLYIRISSHRSLEQGNAQPVGNLLEAATKDTKFAVGLAIARRIVHSHRGQLWLDCQTDGSVVFHVVLPGRVEDIRLCKESPKPHVPGFSLASSSTPSHSGEK
jgi:light-regulated signal transduction histidine kinase (bacteriophytochrome)